MIAELMKSNSSDFIVLFRDSNLLKKFVSHDSLEEKSIFGRYFNVVLFSQYTNFHHGYI